MAVKARLLNRPSDFAESAKDEMKRDVHARSAPESGPNGPDFVSANDFAKSRRTLLHGLAEVSVAYKTDSLPLVARMLG